MARIFAVLAAAVALAATVAHCLPTLQEEHEQEFVPFTGVYPPHPSPARVEEIAAVEDGALRNLGITEGYFELSRALTKFFGSEENSWPSYATWASYSVGFGIRNETLDSIVDERIKPKYPLIAKALEMFPYTRIGLYNQLMSHCTINLAMGNMVVWRQVGGAMSGMISLFGQSTVANYTSLDAYLSTFEPAPAPAGEAQLALAVKAYYQARFTTDAREKSQLIALANALIGWDEQAKLQTALEGAFAPIEFVLPKALGGETIKIPMEGILTSMFTYDLPDEYLIVSQDMRPPPNATTVFPPNLETLTNKDLIAAYNNFEAKLDTIVGTATYDWLSLPQRMRYVLAMMRTRQSDLALFHCFPYRPDQVEAIHQLVYPKNMTMCLANCFCDYGPVV